MSVDATSVASTTAATSATSAAANPVTRWVAIGLTAFALGGALMAAQMSRKKRRLQEYIAGRNVIAEQLDTLVYAQGVLKMAARQSELAPGNRELAACLGEGGICAATDPTRQVAIAIRMALDPAAPLLVGTTEHPAIYGGTGKVGCDPTVDDACPGWSAQAWFWAECPDGAPQCAKAVRLHVRHLVAPTGELEGLPEVPSADELEQNPSAFARPVELAH
jgi:hypothetical protein